MPRHSDLKRELYLKLNSVRGLKCITTKWGCGILIFYFDQNPITKNQLTKWRLWIESAWRLENDRGIIIGHRDEDKQILKELRRLHKKTVLTIQYAKKTWDLTLGFERGIKLRAFVNSVDNEQWELRGSDGYRIGVVGGLRISQERVESDEKNLESIKRYNANKPSSGMT